MSASTTFSLTLGIAELLDRQVGFITDSTDGYVAYKQESLQNSIEDYETRIEEKQAILEAVAVEKRLQKLVQVLEKEIEVMGVEKKLQGKVKQQIDKVQKEYFLKEKLRLLMLIKAPESLKKIYLRTALLLQNFTSNFRHQL